MGAWGRGGSLGGPEKGGKRLWGAGRGAVGTFQPRTLLAGTLRALGASFCK